MRDAWNKGFCDIKYIVNQRSSLLSFLRRIRAFIRSSSQWPCCWIHQSLPRSSLVPPSAWPCLLRKVKASRALQLLTIRIQRRSTSWKEVRKWTIAWPSSHNSNILRSRYQKRSPGWSAAQRCQWLWSERKHFWSSPKRHWTTYHKDYLLVYLACIDEIKDLHHHKGIEDEGEMSWVDLGIFERLLIVFSTWNGEESSTANGTAYLPIVPLVFRVRDEDGLRVEAVGFFRDEGFSHEDEDHHDDDLKDRLADYVLHHWLWNDVIVSWVGFAEKKVLVRVLSC